MASMLGANLDVLSTRITLTTPKGGGADDAEKLYLDFQFSPEKVVTLHRYCSPAQDPDRGERENPTESTALTLSWNTAQG
jgi:hypothetical protein